MSTMASQITSLTIVYPIVYLSADQRKYQSSALLAFVRGIRWGPVNSPHKGPVTRKRFSFDEFITMLVAVTRKRKTCISDVKIRWYLMCYQVKLLITTSSVNLGNALAIGPIAIEEHKISIAPMNDVIASNKNLKTTNIALSLVYFYFFVATNPVAQSLTFLTCLQNVLIICIVTFP